MVDGQESGRPVGSLHLPPGALGEHRVVRVEGPWGARAWLKRYAPYPQDAAHEAAALALVARLLSRRVVPQVLELDAAGGRLLLSDVSGGRASLAHRTRARAADPVDAFALGHALHQLHQDTQRVPLRALLPGAAGRRRRWAQQVVGRVPESVELLHSAEQVAPVLVHGNPRPEDFFCQGGDVQLVDLEDAGPGDPAQDLGLLLGRWCLAGADLTLLLATLRAYGTLDRGLSCRACRYVGLGLCLDTLPGRRDLGELGLRLLGSRTTTVEVGLRACCALR